MLLFLDTEFTDFTTRGLISIGLVSLDGEHEFYAELTDFDYEACSDFVRSNVWAQLGRYPLGQIKQRELGTRLMRWFETFMQPITLAFDSDVDQALLLAALAGQPLPLLTAPADLRELLSSSCASRHLRDFYGPDRPAHHALYDAQALRSAWMSCGYGRPCDSDPCPCKEGGQ